MRDDLVLGHLHVVDIVMAEIAPRLPDFVDQENLRAAGLLGLVEASRRFDETLQVPFERYARIRVRGAIVDATRIGI